MATSNTYPPPPASPSDDAAIAAYLRRATQPAPAPAEDPRDRIYSGTIDRPAAAEMQTQPARNRRGTARKVSPFSIVLGLIFTAVVSVLYISNILAVDRLVIEVGEMNSAYARLRNEQELLRTQVNRLAGLERIRQLAEQNFGMRNSEAVPGWLTVSPDRVAEFEALERSIRKARP